MGATGSPDVVRHSVFNTRDCEETARYSSEFFAVSGLARTHKQEEQKMGPQAVGLPLGRLPNRHRIQSTGIMLPQTCDSFHPSSSPMNLQRNFRPFSARRLRCPDPWSHISLVLAVSESTQA